jgi:hypothetical protein
MVESLITLLDKFTPEILVILSGLLVITTTLFLWLWFANRRSYNLLRHQLPASVVKQYLDTVIQNSNTLKNALFRGGVEGLDPMSLPQGQGSPVNTEQIAQFISKSNPQVLVSGGDDSGLRAQLNQKISELAALQSQLSSAQSAKRELESSFAGAQARIKELEALLAQAGKSSGADPALTAELEKIKKERNEFQNKLKEYEIIEDDLANLKRLQQENQQLKRALAEASGGSVPDSIAPPSIEPAAKIQPPEDLFDEVVEDKVTQDLEQFLGGSEPQAQAEAEAEEEPVKAAAAPEAADKSSEKSPEDLLSEFEKMLG